MLHPAWHFAWCETYKLNKQGDNIQPWRTPFPIWNQSVVPCPVLTVASWPAYKFLRRQVKWSDIPIFLKIFYNLLWCSTVKGFNVVNEAEVDVLKFSCFSKSSLNTWKFSVHVLFKSCLENFEHYFSSVRWVQLCGSLSILWHYLSLGLEWKLTFSSPVATAEFSKFAGILSAALSQHHLLGFELAQLEFHHLH